MLGAGKKSYIDMNQSAENEQYVSPTIQDLYTALLGSKVWIINAYDVNGIFFLTVLLTLLWMEENSFSVSFLKLTIRESQSNSNKALLNLSAQNLD